jgi:hypothetical protein
VPVANPGPFVRWVGGSQKSLPALLARAAVFEAAVAWQKMGDDVAATMRGDFVERRLVCDRLRAAIARALAAENQTGAEEER